MWCFALYFFLFQSIFSSLAWYWPVLLCEARCVVQTLRFCPSDYKESSAELPAGAVQKQRARSRTDPAGCPECQRGESTARTKTKVHPAPAHSFALSVWSARESQPEVIKVRLTTTLSRCGNPASCFSDLVACSSGPLYRLWPKNNNKRIKKLNSPLMFLHVLFFFFSHFRPSWRRRRTPTRSKCWSGWTPPSLLPCSLSRRLQMAEQQRTSSSLWPRSERGSTVSSHSRRDCQNNTFWFF